MVRAAAAKRVLVGGKIIARSLPPHQRPTFCIHKGKWEMTNFDSNKKKWVVTKMTFDTKWNEMLLNVKLLFPLKSGFVDLGQACAVGSRCEVENICQHRRSTHGGI